MRQKQKFERIIKHSFVFHNPEHEDYGVCVCVCMLDLIFIGRESTFAHISLKILENDNDPSRMSPTKWNCHDIKISYIVSKV